MGDENFRQTVKPINIPERQLTTSQQVNTLLGVCGMMWSMLNSPKEEGALEQKHADFSCRAAAETTFIKACDALQLVLSEPERWDFSFQLNIERDYHESIELNKEFLRAQKRHAEEAASPHFRMQPTLMKLTDNTWLAMCGDLNHMEHAILGVGASPREAMESFDKSFNGELSESVVQFINTHIHEQQMDPGTNQHSQLPPPSGQDDAPDSQGTWPVS